jgi:murein DD-endopeptidase MepM/ murein hydrolase activator NlpD
MTFAVLLTTAAAAAMLASPSAAGQPPSLDDQIAAADAELRAAQAKLADTFEVFTDAERRLKATTAAAKSAAAKATKTRSAAVTATQQERDLRLRYDEFAEASFHQGSAISQFQAYFGSNSPSELLDRAALMDALSGEYNEVLSATQQAVDRKTTADRQARSALDQAVRDRDAAARAKTDAERAYQAAVDVQDDAKAETSRLAARRASLASQSAGSNDAPIQASGGVALPARGTLTSTYGPRGGTIHYGIDIANSIGTPIVSAMAGEVVESGPASGFGLWVRVQHADGTITVYGHINESLVSAGQQVAAGEQIATIGNRGQSTGPHLHFEVHQDGNKIDPLPWLRSFGVSI